MFLLILIIFLGVLGVLHLIVSYFWCKKFISGNPKQILWKMPLATLYLTPVVFIIGEIITYIGIFIFNPRFHGGPVELLWVFYIQYILVASFLLSIFIYFFKNETKQRIETEL